MSSPDLGNIQTVEARELWKDEARDFTLWLAETAQQLSEAIGIPVEIDSNWHERTLRLADETFDDYAEDGEGGLGVNVFYN